MSTARSWAAPARDAADVPRACRPGDFGVHTARMARRTPDGPPPEPVAQRLRLRYAKRGRLRFSSHRDFARSFERALRRAEIPMAYSAGFHPHPKISYGGAAPTGAASEAEFLEIAVIRPLVPDDVRRDLDAALPDGLDIVEVVEAVVGSGSLAERMVASHWQVDLRGVSVEQLQTAVELFLAAAEVPVERLTKDGRRVIDARGAVVSAAALPADPDTPDAAAAPVAEGPTANRAILDLVVRQATPAVRPDDVLVALQSVAGLAPTSAPLAVRLAQGPLDDTARVGDPLVPDRAVREPAS